MPHSNDRSNKKSTHDHLSIRRNTISGMMTATCFCCIKYGKAIHPWRV